MTMVGKQGDLFGGPAPARATDTSRMAADALGPDLSKLRRAALVAIVRAGADGLTADEVADLLKISILTARPRCSELHGGGFTEDSGRRRPSKHSRHLMTAWMATDAGRAAVAHEGFES